MSVALYRKYRPKTFAEVSGQNHIKITLQNEIVSGRVVHAYLFCGPRGTGKTTMARLLAKAVNCLEIQPNGEPCNRCQSCVDIMDNKALDIIEIDAASHTGVDNVRENIIQNARFTPVKNKFKVFIIDEVHMLSISAFNALLKILEESPSYVIFILATTEAHKVPNTIISRCQRFDFKKISFAELVSRLKWIVNQEETRVDEAVLSLIAKQSGGCVRDAESLLEQVLSLGEKNITAEQAELILPKADFELLFQLFEMILERKGAAAVELINKLTQEGFDIQLFVNHFIEFVRRILLYKISADLDELSRDIEDAVVQKILKLAPQISPLFLTAMIREFVGSRETFKQSCITQLGAEMAALKLTGAPAAAIERHGQNLKKESAVETIKIDQKVTLSSEVLPVEREKAESQAALKKEDVFPGPLADDNGQVLSRASAPDAGECEFQHWERLLAQVKEKNYSLYLSLRMGKPIFFDGEQLTLGFVFDIQRQQVEKGENKRLLVELLENIAGRKVAISTRMDSSLRIGQLFNGKGSAPAVSSVDQLANEFGGTIIES
jgi:DNA polymerase-3 subunit gamma/tau